MKILSTLLEISVYSAAIILFILLIKKVIGKRMTAAVQFSLWVLLILRLMIPFSLDSGLHLVKLSAPITPESIEVAAHEYLPNDYNNEPSLSYAPVTDSNTTNSNIETTSQQQLSTQPEQQETYKQQTYFEPTLSNILIAVWLAGVIAMLMFMALTYSRLRRRIQNSATVLVPQNVQTMIDECKLRMNVSRTVDVLISSEFESTMLLAALRPKLIIPVSMIEDQNDEVLKHCLLHEFAHCKRRDYLWYLLVNVLCAVYWFNPAVWLGIRLMKQDMEAACDAHVVRSMTDSERNSYARTLLSMFTNQTKRFQIAMGMGIAAKKEAAKRLRGIYMKRKMKLRTKLTISILVMLMLFTCFTTACQPGEADMRELEVDEPQIEADNEDIATSSITQLSFEAPTEPYTAPAHWTETVEDEKLTIEIDADITLPETTKFPVARVEPLKFTQEYVDELVEYFAPNSTLYEYPQPMIKADYERWIEEARKGDYIDGAYVVTEDSKEHVAELREQQAKAPVGVSNVYVDTTLTYPIVDPNEPRDIEGGKNFLTVAVERSGQEDPIICVANFVEGYNDKVLFYYSERSYIPESRIIHVIENEYPDVPYYTQTIEAYSRLKEIVDSMTLMQEDAQPHSEKVLSDLGIDYMHLVNVEKAAAYKYLNEETDISDPDVGGYLFEYMRDFGGMVGYERNDSYGQKFWQEPPAYVAPFEQETVKILVTEKGVQYFSWSGGARVTEEISDSVKLLPFGQIQQALINQIRNMTRNTVRVKVVSAELSLGYIDTEDPQQALMVPVWVFNTVDINKLYNQQTLDYKWIEGSVDHVYINAIDGGIIVRSMPEEIN